MQVIVPERGEEERRKNDATVLKQSNGQEGRGFFHYKKTENGGKRRQVAEGSGRKNAQTETIIFLVKHECVEACKNVAGTCTR